MAVPNINGIQLTGAGTFTSSVLSSDEWARIVGRQTKSAIDQADRAGDRTDEILAAISSLREQVEDLTKTVTDLTFGLGKL